MNRFVLAGLLLAFACGRPVPEEEIGPPRMDVSSAPADQAGSRQPDSSSHPGWTIPSGWQELAPSSSMRIFQARVPGPAGPGEIAVFFFGEGQGGTVESNFDRWLGQMTLDSEPRRDSFVNGPFTVSSLEASGTLSPSPMSGVTEARPDSKLLAAVIEGPGGPWFVKLTGPVGTIDENRDAFLEFLRSFDPAG